MLKSCFDTNKITDTFTIFAWVQVVPNSWHTVTQKLIYKIRIFPRNNL